MTFFKKNFNSKQRTKLKTANSDSIYFRSSVNMVFDNAFGYEIRHFKNYSRKWPTFQVRELVLHPATERVSVVICVMKSS